MGSPELPLLCSGNQQAGGERRGADGQIPAQREQYLLTCGRVGVVEEEALEPAWESMSAGTLGRGRQAQRSL